MDSLSQLWWLVTYQDGLQRLQPFHW